MIESPSSQIDQTNYLNSKRKLLNEQTKLIKEKILGEKANDFNNGVTANRIFFDRYKKISGKKYIKALRSPDMEVKTSHPEILDIACKFYQNLFKKKSSDNNVSKWILDIMPVLDPDDSLMKYLLEPISMAELKDVVFFFLKW